MIVRWMVRVLVCFVCVMPLVAETPAEVPTAKVEKFGATPLAFEPNLGQTDPSVRFLSRGDRYGLFLTDTEAIMSLSGATPAVVRMSLVGQNAHPSISGASPQPGMSHYVMGSDASKWQDAVPHFQRVEYKDVYPGIGLSYYGNQRQLEYDFTVAPHANPRVIELAFSGADKISIGDQGDLILHTAAGDIRHERPRMYQQRNGAEIPVAGEFTLLDAGKVGFAVGTYDVSLPLVIDPKFVYSTIFGGEGKNGDTAYDIKVDATGTTYVTGYTSSVNFFNTNLSTAPAGGSLDAFLLKLDPTGTVILSALYFGGTADDEGHRIALDSAGNIYIAGYTTSKDFPIVNGFQTTIGGRKDVYIAKIDKAATKILFSSYLGGSLDDTLYGLSVDASGNIYLAGETLSTNFPVVKAIRPKFAGGFADGFVAKIAPTGKVTYATYIGGRGNDRAYDVTSDADGNAFVVGFTSSSDFPIANALQGKFRGGSEDAFLTKLSPDGSTYLISTYLGGSGNEEAIRVLVDSAKNIVIAGYTSSADFPISSAIQTSPAGSFDIFVTKLAADGITPVFSTYIGSDGAESAPGLALGADDSIYLAGFTSSSTFPVINGVDIGISGGGLKGERDAYVVKLTTDGRIIYSTYIGGADSDGAVGIAVDASGNAYVAGYTFSSNFNEVNSLQNARPTTGTVLVTTFGDDTTKYVAPDQGAVMLSAIGNGKALKLDHAVVSGPADGTRPAGMAFMEYRRAGSEVAETSLPLLPQIQDGLIVVNETSSLSTFLSITNASTSDVVSMYFFLTKTPGEKTSYGSASIPASTTVDLPVTGPLLALPANATGTLSFSTTAPVSATAYTTYTVFSQANTNTVISYLPIVNPYSTETRTTTIPHFESSPNWVSEFTLTNPSDVTVSGVVRFFGNGLNGGDPTQSSSPVALKLDTLSAAASSVSYTLGPRVSTTFKTVSTSDDIAGYAQVVPSSGTLTPIATVLLVRNDGTLNTLRTAVESQIPGASFRLYGERSGDFNNAKPNSTATAITITNPLDTATTVTLSLFNMDGTSTGLSSAIALPARGHLTKYLHQISGLTATPNPFQGIVKVQATAAGVTVFSMRIRIAENGSIVGTATGPIKENTGTDVTAIFPYLLDGGGYATKVVLFSDASGVGSTGTVEVVNEETQIPSTGGSSGFLLKINADDVTSSAPIVVPNKGGTTLSTVGGSNAIQFAHATLDVPAGAKHPVGMAILDLRQSGGEVTEAALPLLPLITDGRVYLNETSTRATNLAILNPYSTPVVMYYFMTNNAGNNSNYGSVTIPAKSSFAEPMSATPLSLPADAIGTFTFSVDPSTPVAASAFRTFNEGSAILISPLPIVNPYSVETRTVTISHFVWTVNWGSEFVLVNPTDSTITGTMQFFTTPDQSDPTLSTVPTTITLDIGAPNPVPYSIAPRGNYSFGTGAASDAGFSGYVQIVPDAGSVTPSVTEFLAYANAGVYTIHSTVEAQLPGNDFRLFAELDGKFDSQEGHSTAMAFAMSNPSATPTTVTMTLVKMDGTSTGLSTSFTLAAGGHYAAYLHQMDAFKSMSNPFQGTVLVHASGPGVVLFSMRDRYTETGALVGTTTGPLKEEAATAAVTVFPHVLDGGGYATEFILFTDTSGAGTSGTISFTDDNGRTQPLSIQ